MKDQVYKDVLLDIHEHENAEIVCFPSSAGTFSLRRANYLINAGKLLLNAEQVRALADHIPEKDTVAKQRMIANHLRKVVNIAQRYANHGLALLELVSEGIAGLIHALKKFELEGGFRFSAYATQCIRHNIERAIIRRNNLLQSIQTVPAA